MDHPRMFNRPVIPKVYTRSYGRLFNASNSTATVVVIQKFRRLIDLLFKWGI